MENKEFTKIQRGNGVANDALATIAEISEENYRKLAKLEEKIDTIDSQNSPREKSSYRLLILSIIISLVGLYIQIYF